MSITTTTRQASIDEIAAEMDRRGMVIEQLEARLAHIDGIDAGAIDNLHHHQRQLDADGIEVGVSRQALLEVLTGVEAALPALRAAPAGDVAEALNPDALAALKNGQRQLDQDGVEVGVSRQALDELIAAFEARTALSAQGWRTMDSAPKDGTKILVCYDSESDPYQSDDPNRLTPYGTHAEGGDFLDGTGITVAVWVDGWHESTDEYGSGYWMPGWWFAWFNGDTNYVVAPTGWLPLDYFPAAPTAQGGA